MKQKPLQLLEIFFPVFQGCSEGQWALLLALVSVFALKLRKCYLKLKPLIMNEKMKKALVQQLALHLFFQVAPSHVMQTLSK